MSNRPDLRNPVLLIAFGFGAGLAPAAPGTWGTLLAVPLWWMFSGIGIPLYLLLAAAAFVAGIWICGRASAALGEHDHAGIVIDEVVGYFAALAVVPADPVWLVLSFVVFRAFDILKPWPIGWLDRRVGGGLGIMVDDLIAGLYTVAVLLVALSLWN